MKTIMKCVLTIAVAVFTTTLFAQHNSHGKESKSPKEIAQVKVDKMADSLALNDKQKKEIYALVLAKIENRSAEKARIGAIQDPEAKKAEIKKVMDEHKAQLQKILTPEQFTKWQQMQQRQRQSMMKHHKQAKAESVCNCECNKETCCKEGNCANCDCKKECAKTKCCKGEAVKGCSKSGDCKKECTKQECPKSGDCKKECPKK